MTKLEVLEIIAHEKWLHLTQQDLIPYKSNLEQGVWEQRWKTEICWARKDGVVHKLMESGRHNNWDLLSDGHRFFERVNIAFRDGKLDVSQCFRWNDSFKTKLCPSYKRPVEYFEDTALSGDEDYELWLKGYLDDAYAQESE